MKTKRSNSTGKTYLKGYEPKTIKFKSGRALNTNGLTKEEWNSLKKKKTFKKLSLKDKIITKGLLSI
jgi:hypothetical protein